MRLSPFRRVGVFMNAVLAPVEKGISMALAASQVGQYESRGKGKGSFGGGNKHAKSSFKQNKRRGL